MTSDGYGKTDELASEARTIGETPEVEVIGCAGPPEPSIEPPQTRATRVRRFASRTKTGCFTCRSRKKKCDEGQPFCEIDIQKFNGTSLTRAQATHVPGQALCVRVTPIPVASLLYHLLPTPLSLAQRSPRGNHVIPKRQERRPLHSMTTLLNRCHI